MRQLTVVFIALALMAIAQAQEATLRWGAATDSNAPYGFYNAHGKLTGFEYEIITAVAKEMGRKPVFVQNSWDGLIPGLGRNLYDCVICGIEITPAKAKEVLFSDPYYVTFEQLVDRKGTPPITSLSQLTGKEIGTLDQTAAQTMLEKTPGVKALPYPEEVNAYADVANRDAFVCTVDSAVRQCRRACSTCRGCHSALVKKFASVHCLTLLASALSGLAIRNSLVFKSIAQALVA